MNRIFDTAYITDICSRLKAIIYDAQEELGRISNIITEAENAANQVPPELRNQNIYIAAANLSDGIKECKFESLLAKIDKCTQYACTEIPNADSQFATQTKALKEITDNITEALEDIIGFLINTPFTIDYANFKINFEEVIERCNEILEDSDVNIAHLVQSVNGQEAKSIYYSKDPVNLSTGNFIYSRTDLTIKGDIQFYFNRFYNARNDRAGAFGPDWNHNYEVRLLTEENAKVLVLEDGKVERFILSSDGVYISKFASTSKLTKSENGYMYCTREQKVYMFDEEGYCREIHMENGIQISLFYKEGRNGKLLEKIEKETGEYFIIAYNEQERISCVSDHTGRSIYYETKDGFLSSVSTTSGGHFIYSYTDDGKLQSVQNPEGVSIVCNRFDENGRTVEQIFPDGSKMDYIYDDKKRTVTLKERNGSCVTYIHDSKYRDICHIYKDGEERFAYNNKNQKTMFIDKLGNKTQYSYDINGNRTCVINPLGDKMELQYEKGNRLSYVAINNKQRVRNFYDETGNLIETRDAMGYSYNFTYENKKYLQLIQQPDGGVVELQRDERGNIICLTDPNGNKYYFSYDARNQMIKTIDGNGNEMKYEYDNSGNIASVIRADGSVRSYEYNKCNKITKIKDFDGSVVTRQYNNLNKLSAVTDRMGHITKYKYDKMWNLESIEKPDGSKVTRTYDENNYLISVCNAAGNKTRYIRDAVGHKTAVIDELGRKTQFVRDPLGRIVNTIAANGTVTEYAYDAEGHLTFVKDALGNEVHRSYDENGKMIKETNPLGESRHYQYTSMGQLCCIEDEKGQRTRYEYDKAGHLTTISFPEGTKASYVHDGNGNVISYINPKGHVSTYYYDQLNRVIEIAGSNGEKKQFYYDEMDRITKKIDGRGGITQYAYSPTGRLIKAIDPLGHEAVYEYDVCDRLTEIRQYGESLEQDILEVQKLNNRECQITRYAHDIMGRVTAVTDSLGNTENMEYDGVGQLTKRIDKDGLLTSYIYSDRGELEQVSYSDGRDVILRYNPIGQLCELEDVMGTTKFSHDAMGHLIEVVDYNMQKTTYTYGTRGERTGMTLPDGTHVDYGYDAFTRLLSISAPDYSASYQYDNTGKLIQRATDNGIRTEYEYDNRGMITRLANIDAEGIIDEYKYGYDNTGNRIAVDQSIRGAEEENGVYGYTYDILGQLTGVAKDGINLRTYTYDAFGNRASKMEENIVTEYSYDEGNRLIWEITGNEKTDYAYDCRGNLICEVKNGVEIAQMNYDIAGLLVQAQRGEKTAKYFYDGLGQLRHRQEISANGEAVISAAQYLPDWTDKNHKLLQQVVDGKESTFLWDTKISAILEEGKAKYLVGDMAGSPLHLISKNGQLEEVYSYDEFGNDISNNQGEGQIVGFTGYIYDKISGNYFAQARHYNPSTGRFVERDSFPTLQSAAITMNKYTYCYNHPVGFVDRNGCFTSFDDICDSVNDTLDDWGDTLEDVASDVGDFIGDTIDDVSEAISEPVGYVCGEITRLGTEHPIIKDIVVETVKLPLRAVCNYSLGEVLMTYMTQEGYLDEIMSDVDFKRDDAGIFHVPEDCWQQHLGYNDLYDWVFYAATECDKKKYYYNVGGENYCMWMWKGDYLNLGAGAESGIYKGSGYHMDTATMDATTMTLTTINKETGETIMNYEPSNPQWWITGFDPMSQSFAPDNIEVYGSIKFESKDVWEDFKEAYNDSRNAGVRDIFCFDNETQTAYYKW